MPPTPPFDRAFQRTLAHNTWSMFAVAMVIVGLRLYAQIRRLGWRGCRTDDYVMLLAAAWYTTLIVCLNVIAAGGGSNLAPPGRLQGISEEEIRERVWGSKIVVVSEQAMLNTIYTLKACLLLMYARLTAGSAYARWVRLLALYTGTGWLASQTAFLTACRPLNGYWTVPAPNAQCATLARYAIVQAVFNISSDVCMLGISLPMIAALHLPPRKKAVLGVVFGMGGFVVVAAVLTKAFNLSDVWDPRYMLWYAREASTAVWVANAPLVWPLLREWVPVLRTASRTERSLPGHKSGGPATLEAGLRAPAGTRDTGSKETLTEGGGSEKEMGLVLPVRPLPAAREGVRAPPPTPADGMSGAWGVGRIRKEVRIEVESSARGRGEGGDARYGGI
ncbi:hypothetical protein EJ06DRAFT_505487 [Trichodelitschia bisporula]|uniref:Rhodopsin domain-containing protein n=1 Tax=Trichodelitschia bisporula TaxID=703511 RepID=A0A6G1I6W1_9PEZI|nr:hypothetical protein EJ06DRAFT_505487 [Trichodelitschia bisporula]